MKKTLLLSAALIAALGTSAQTAKLTDVTPAGYDFSKYEDGAVLKVHLPEAGKVSWADPSPAYNAAEFAADGQFTALGRWGNEALPGDEGALRIKDFGGHLGKCLVFSTLYGPLQANVAGGYGPVKSVEKVGGNSKFQLACYVDPGQIQHGWSGAAIRVRIVYTILHRGRHAISNGWPATKNNMFTGAYAFNNHNYVPTGSNESGITAVGYDMSKYVKWENEGDCLAEMPAEKIVKSGVGVEDPFDTAGQVNDAYTNQIERFHVVEFDTYAPYDDQPLVACFEFINQHVSVVIKEIKFFNIDNAMELLDSNGEPIDGASYLNDRAESFRYYTEKGVKEFETTEPQPTLGLNGSGTEADPYLIGTAEDLCIAYRYNNKPDNTVYYRQTADIDMAGVTTWHSLNGYNGGFDIYENPSARFYCSAINYDGGNHVIKNFAPAWRETIDNNDNSCTDYYNTTIFGVLTGTVKNLGIVDADAQNSAGILAAYAGHSHAAAIAPVTVLDNVFVTGKVSGNSGYIGGFFGTTGSNIEMKNCYGQIEVVNENAAGYTAGICGRLRNELTINNCYISADVTANGTKALAAATDKTPAVKATDMVAFGNGDIFASAINATSTNVESAAAPTAELIAKIQGWSAFNQKKLFNNLPALNWQSEQSGIGEIITDGDADAAPVYYNLQGVQVENPANGLYIVKRGNKVTKEIIR